MQTQGKVNICACFFTRMQDKVIVEKYLINTFKIWKVHIFRNDINKLKLQS